MYKKFELITWGKLCKYNNLLNFSKKKTYEITLKIRRQAEK